MENLLVTGGSGFIGSNFIWYLLEDTDFKGRIINIDKLTYAGNPENLAGIEKNTLAATSLSRQIYASWMKLPLYSRTIQ
jgi:dTDP-D-glucose 4,6-dehydratase